MLSRLSYWMSFPFRWFHRRGFGVQSSWAFEFVTQVLYKDSQYYIFRELNGNKQDEQLFRICNWLKAGNIGIHCENTITKAYLLAPISKDKSKHSDYSVNYYDSSHTNDLESDINENTFNENTCVIVDSIHNQNSSTWKRLLSLPSVTTVFDMGKRGIAFFDHKRQKQTYLT
mgnify:CR=1 FL=1